MGIVFEKPPVRQPSQVRKAGGDDSVERDGMGRPRIINKCSKCEGTGRLPSEKREGQTVKCIRCSGNGYKKESYTRVTTFIDVLDSKDTLMDWKARMVLKGAALDPGFLVGVESMDPNNADDRKTLSKRAEAAADMAGASEKADDGTRLHELSERVDEGLHLPPGTTMEDAADMEAYRNGTRAMRIVRMEQLVVNDRFRIAGTPDRVSTVDPAYELVTPSGELVLPDELLITDLKTGRVDYGGLKMAMQLAVYANSDLYDKDTGARLPAGNINRKWGIIMHLPVGSAKLDLYWADLSLGWEAVHLASLVRDMRSRGKGALHQFTIPTA